MCIRCNPGEEPDALQTECQACVGTYSVDGERVLGVSLLAARRLSDSVRAHARLARRWDRTASVRTALHATYAKQAAKWMRRAIDVHSVQLRYAQCRWLDVRQLSAWITSSRPAWWTVSANRRRCGCL